MATDSIINKENEKNGQNMHKSILEIVMENKSFLKFRFFFNRKWTFIKHTRKICLAYEMPNYDDIYVAAKH